MASYILPRESYDLLVETFGDKIKAEKMAKAFETAIESIDNKAKELIIEKKNSIKIELKEELKNELVTRELFEQRCNSIEERFNSVYERFNLIDEKFNLIDEKFKILNFKLNIFIVIALLALTFANPTFTELIKKIFF